MNHNATEWRAALGRAWGEMLDFPPPRFLRTAPRGSGVLIGAAFPLLGWIIGITWSLLCTLFSAAFNTTAGALVFSGGAWLFLTFKDQGRGDAELTGLLGARLDRGGDGVSWKATFPVLASGLKFALLLLLALRGSVWYFAVITTGAFAIQAALALYALPRPLLPGGWAGRRNFWIICGGLTIVTLLFSRLGGAFGIVAFVLLWRYFEKGMERDGFSPERINFAGTVTEWVLLFTGMLGL